MSNPQSIQLTSCTDSPWQLVQGTVKLIIMGPGRDAWLACSDAYYSGQIGSDRERKIALAAIEKLKLKHGEDIDAGVPEIRSALAAVTKDFPL